MRRLPFDLILDQTNNQTNEEDGVHDGDVGNDHAIDNTKDLGDTSHHDDTNTTTMEKSIELVKQNRPLLDRLGKFGKVLENLLEIGTAVSEVNSPSSLSAIQVSNRPTG